MTRKDKPIARAAQEVSSAGRTCSESALRRLEAKGIVKPGRDPWGRRLYGQDDIDAAVKYLSKR